MAYSMNILPTEAAYYTLVNAEIIGGRLRLHPGSFVELKIDKTRLSAITSSILINTYTDKLLNPLVTDVRINLDIELLDGTIQRLSVYPNQLNDKALSFPIELSDGDYVECFLRIRSDVDCELIIYELCPELESDVTTIIEGVEQSLPKLLYDYNMGPLEVKQDMTTIGMITCELLQNTDLQGHLLFTFNASEQCDVTIRILDNEMTELFSPSIHTVQPGLNTIGIPHAFLHRLAGYHSFVITAQCTNGILRIPIRGLLFTIDGGYLAARLVQAGIDVSDLALRQLSIESVDEIWVIGLDANITTMRSRGYNAKVGEPWMPRYNFFDTIASAIEFDGIWEEDSSHRFTLITTEWPVVALISKDNTLSIWDYNTDTLEYTKVTDIDTDVCAVSLCRGFSSTEYIEQDQGLVCAYIKNNGTAWYTHFAYHETLSKRIWHAPVLLDNTEEVIQLSVNRLNDYRIGILCTTASYTKWFITSRTYVKQAIPSEAVSLEIEQRNLFYMGENVPKTTNAMALELPESIEKAPNILYGQYFAPVVFPPGMDMSDFFNIYINDIEIYANTTIKEYTEGKDTSTDKVFTFYNVDGKLGIEVNIDTKGMKKIRIKFTNINNYAFIDVTGEGHGWFADSYDFTWTPIITHRTLNEEHVCLNANGNASVIYKPIITTAAIPSIEQVTLNIQTDATISTKQIITKSYDSPQETCTLAVETTAIITMTQTGEQPI